MKTVKYVLGIGFPFILGSAGGLAFDYEHQYMIGLMLGGIILTMVVVIFAAFGVLKLSDSIGIAILCIAAAILSGPTFGVGLVRIWDIFWKTVSTPSGMLATVLVLLAVFFLTNRFEYFDHGKTKTRPERGNNGNKD